MLRYWKLILIGAPLLFLGAFFFYPLANLIRLSLTAVSIQEFFSRRYYLQVVGFTLWQAALSTLLTLLAGLPTAYLFARYQFRGKTVLRALTMLPFVMPTVVTAAAFRALFGATSPLNRGLTALFQLDRPFFQLDHTLTIILMAHVFYNLAVATRLIGGFWAHLSPDLAEAARVLGAPPRRAFREITLPLLSPAIFSAAALTFLFTFTSFGVILILGGPTFSSIETEIYRQYVTFLNPGAAAALSLLQIGFTFILMLVYARLQRKTAVSLNFLPQRATLKQAQNWKERLFVGGTAVALLLFIISPLLALLWRSLIDREGQLTLAYYQALPTLKRGNALFVPPLTAVRNSIGYAILTALTAGFLGTLTAVTLSRPHRGRILLEPIFMLPLGASAVTLGLGYVVSFSALRASPALTLIAHTLVAFPFVARTLTPVLQGINPGLREAAGVLGASPGRIWREVDLPIMGRALLAAAAFAFTVSMGEFGATSFIARPNSGYLTMPIAIQRYLAQPGALNFGQAMAMSVILMAVCATGFMVIERFRYADVGEF